MLPEYTSFESVALSRDDDGILLARLHSGDGPLEFSMAAHADWVTLWREIAHDPHTRLVIVTGTGDEFMTPRKALPGGSDRSSLMTPEYWKFIMQHCRELVTAMLDVPVPMIAAVNGPARVHSEIALLNDIVVAAPTTVFQDTHMPEQVIPTDLQHVLIPALIGRIRASYFFYTDQVIDAQEALRLGMINEIVPAGRVVERAYQIARHILRQPDANLQYLRRIFTHELRGKMHNLLEYGLAVEGLAAMGADWSSWQVHLDGPPPLD